MDIILTLTTNTTLRATLRFLRTTEGSRAGSTGKGERDSVGGGSARIPRTGEVGLGCLFCNYGQSPASLTTHISVSLRRSRTRAA